MTSKWIKEIYEEFYNKNEIGDLDSVDVILRRIDKLLTKSMLDTDDENLFEEIRKEVEDDGLQRGQRRTIGKKTSQSYERT